mmetsp:Transcript_6596/g.13487  ORF Transcript_6596/g.13487 Transcript_6596/m.13487 type:complete len:227 (-) Transcript_6596:9-689(-)
MALLKPAKMAPAHMRRARPTTAKPPCLTTIWPDLRSERGDRAPRSEVRPTRRVAGPTGTIRPWWRRQRGGTAPSAACFRPYHLGWTMAPGRVGRVSEAMAAAVRQGRDSWCRCARSPPFRGWHDICSSTVTGLDRARGSSTRTRGLERRSRRNGDVSDVRQNGPRSRPRRCARGPDHRVLRGYRSHRRCANFGGRPSRERRPPKGDHRHHGDERVVPRRDCSVGWR